jgi:hypothetical protein
MHILALILLLLFGGCGYKPSSEYSNEVLGDRVYASVVTFIEEPENSILVEDALKEALQTRLNVSFVNRRDIADSEIELSLKSLRFRPLQTDESGYVILYRAEIVLGARHKYFSNGVARTSYYTLNGFYEFPIRPSGSISLALKFDAIKFSALKAVDNLIPKLALKGNSNINR